MENWSRESLSGGGRPPRWLPGREGAVEAVPARQPPQWLLDQLASNIQSRLDELEQMRAALADAYPVFAAGRGRGGPRPDAEDGRYRFSLDVAGFAPEELSVRLEGRRLTVRAKRDRRSEAPDGCVSHEYREVRREVLLPDDADLEALACALDGGRLCVRAPRRAPGTAAIPIPVERPAAPPPASPDDAGAAAEP